MARMNIIKFTERLREGEIESLETIVESIERRVDWYNDREPNSCGETYDKWEEKRDETETLFNDLTEIYDELDDDPELLDADTVKTVKDLINEYQNYIGGLSRWF